MVGLVFLNRFVNDGNKEVNSMLIKFIDSIKSGNIVYIFKIGKVIMSFEEV